MTVLFYDWHLNDLERLYINKHFFTVLSVDTTFNLTFMSLQQPTGT